jgi:hypothetical protein
MGDQFGVALDSVFFVPPHSRPAGAAEHHSDDVERQDVQDNAISWVRAAGTAEHWEAGSAVKVGSF